MSGCPSCDGPGVELGSLGNTRHFRCRDCGWMWSKTSKPRKRKAAPVLATRKSPWGDPDTERSDKWLET